MCSDNLLLVMIQIECLLLKFMIASWLKIMLRWFWSSVQMEIWSKSSIKKARYQNRKVCKLCINLLVVLNSFRKIMSFIEISSQTIYFWKSKEIVFCTNWETLVLQSKNKLMKKLLVLLFLCHLKYSDNKLMDHKLMFGHLVSWFITCSLGSTTL